MQWEKKIKPTPRVGDIERHTVFLWLPKLIENKWVWLEKVIKEREYRTDSYWSYWHYHTIPKKGVKNGRE